MDTKTVNLVPTEYLVTDKSVDDLKEYLKRHESDIQNNINDFGELYTLFVELFGYEPGLGL